MVDTVSAEAREKSISIVLKKGFGTFFATKVPDLTSLRKGLLVSSKNLSVRVLSGVYNGVFNGPQQSAEAESFAALKENDEFLDLVDEDTVFGDKFKMDQVIVITVFPFPPCLCGSLRPVVGHFRRPLWKPS